MRWFGSWSAKPSVGREMITNLLTYRWLPLKCGMTREMNHWRSPHFISKSVADFRREVTKPWKRGKSSIFCTPVCLSVSHHVSHKFPDPNFFSRAAKNFLGPSLRKEDEEKLQPAPAVITCRKQAFFFHSSLFLPRRIVLETRILFPGARGRKGREMTWGIWNSHHAPRFPPSSSFYSRLDCGTCVRSAPHPPVQNCQKPCKSPLPRFPLFITGEELCIPLPDSLFLSFFFYSACNVGLHRSGENTPDSLPVEAVFFPSRVIAMQK